MDPPPPAGSGASGPPPARTVFVSTGDVMGSAHGAALVRSLRRLDEASRRRGGGAAGEAAPGLRVVVLGGGGLLEEADEALGDNTGVSSIGLVEALRYVRPALRLQRRARRRLREAPPDVAVVSARGAVRLSRRAEEAGGGLTADRGQLIDYPGVNIPLGRWLRAELGVPVVYYIPPNEWLATGARTPAICALSAEILAVYAAEAAYYRAAGGAVEFVGHPLRDLTRARHPGRAAAKRALGLDPAGRTVLLLPASRAQELHYVLPVRCAPRRLRVRGRLDGLHRPSD